MKSIDYSAFVVPLTQTEIQTYKHTIQDKWMVTSNQPTWITLAVAGAFFATALAGSQLGWASDTTPMWIVLGVIGVVIAIVYAIVYEISKQRALLSKFAACNGGSYIYKQKDPAFSGMIFDEGDSRVLKNAVAFPDGVQIGEYQYMTGSGKSRQSHNWGFVSCKLPRRLPNMVLDSKKNNIFGLVSNLPDSFGSGQKLSLEGDFDKHFTLYAPEQYKTDALYIFTPDVMQTIIDHGGGYDMEVVDDSFYIYTQNSTGMWKQKSLQDLMSIAEKVGKEIAEQGDYYADERIGDRAQNIVAEPGKRLQTNMSILTIVTLVVYVIYIIAKIVGFF